MGRIVLVDWVREQGCNDGVLGALPTIFLQNPGEVVEKLSKCFDSNRAFCHTQMTLGVIREL